jgi:hypothetical protein
LKKIVSIPCILVSLASSGVAQTGSVAEPVRYIGGQTVDPSVHEGRLRYAIGTENRQTMRANRTHPEYADGYGWTYNHASNLCYWNNTFYQQYLSNPADEHVAPGQTLIVKSKDGRHWEKPEVVFPPYKAPEGVKIPAGYHGYMMHQRMGFYVAPDGRLLVIAFYGHTDDPFGKGESVAWYAKHTRMVLTDRYTLYVMKVKLTGMKVIPRILSTKNQQMLVLSLPVMRC